MDQRTRHDIVTAAHAVAEHLGAGVPLEADDLEAIRQTLGGNSPAQALARLAEEDPESALAAPLLALLYSPGRASRLALEPVLARADLPAQALAAYAAETARLAGNAGGAWGLAPTGERLALPPASGAVEGFALRLRPEATAPVPLRSIAAARFPREAAELGVLLRHSRLVWSPPQRFFLATLLERAAPGPDLAGMAAWALAFLDLAGADFTPREALADRWRALDAMLRQAEAQERALEKGCFEERLSQGMRLGHVHGPAVRAELALLNACARLVVGADGEALAGGGPKELDLGQLDDPEALLRALRG
jgi:hypothetical protein